MHQSIPPALSTAPPPRRATLGHLPAMSVLGVGRLQILHCPGPFPSWVQMEWTDA